MVGMALAKSMYALPTWAKLVRLVSEHAALQVALGCEGHVPSQWACYRFARKLRENGDALDACVSRVIAELHKRLPDYGRDIAIDASDMPAYANGQRYLYNHGPERERFSDPDASWGHRSAVSTRRGGGFYGFKLQAAVCTKTGLPVAWQVETARANESRFVVVCSTLHALVASRSRRWRPTRRTTTTASTPSASSATVSRSSRFGSWQT